MTGPARHVIFGTGAIGLATLEALLRRGETVRMVNRSGSAPVPEEVEVVGGDAADQRFTIDVTSGSRVIYQTLNPPYSRWVEEWPGLQAGVLAAAQAHGARMVSMENVYMYGRPAGRPLTETRDYAAHTKKGQLRARMANELLAAHQAGNVSVAIGRASDYFGPRGGAQSNLGDRLFPAALEGKTASVLGDPDQPHTYTYIPDIGEGLAVLGEHPDAPGRCGTSPTTPTPAPPGNLSTPSSGWPASPGPGSARCRRCCSASSDWPTPRCGSCWRCSTSSRNRSSSTAPRSRSSESPPPPSTQALADTLATYQPTANTNSRPRAPRASRTPLRPERLTAHHRSLIELRPSMATTARHPQRAATRPAGETTRSDRVDRRRIDDGRSSRCRGLVAIPFIPAEQNVLTGAVLLGFALGWACWLGCRYGSVTNPSGGQRRRPAFWR